MRTWVAAACFAVVALCSSSSAAQAPSSSRPSQPPSIESLRTACEAQNGAACDEIGRRYLSGEGVPVDDGRASEALANACRYGDGLGCSRLGFIYEAGRGVTADAGLSRHYVSKRQVEDLRSWMADLQTWSGTMTVCLQKLTGPM